MINLWKKEDLNLLSKHYKEIVDNVINILDESYGNNRKVTDDGVYVCVIEDIEEVEYLKVNILKGLIEEFRMLYMKIILINIVQHYTYYQVITLLL